jgi:protein arginine kinase
MRQKISEKNRLWFSETKKDSEIAISSRIRLARNIVGIPFPQWASDEQLAKIGSLVKDAVSSSPYLSKLSFVSMDEISSIERQALSEEHVISPQFTEPSKGSFLAFSDDHNIGIMINEEDHLRIQVLSTGQELERIWKIANKIDEELGKKVNFSFSEKWGFLTACPTNVGTALRVSLMLHLPALVMTHQLPSLFQMVGQVGATVRGLFGEGTHAVGNFYQISNGSTLGIKEEELVEHIRNIGLQIADKERSARKILYTKARDKLADHSHRALGILKYAKLMSFDEAMELLSMIRLGMDLNLIHPVDVSDLNRLMIDIRPAHLWKHKGERLSSKEEERERTKLIRSVLKNEEEI